MPEGPTVAKLAATRVILDDRRARRVAVRFALPLTGTVGVLLRAKERGLIESVRKPLEHLVHAGFRLSKSLFEEAIRLGGE